MGRKIWGADKTSFHPTCIAEHRITAMTNGMELEQKEVFKHKGLPDHSFVRKPLP